MMFLFQEVERILHRYDVALELLAAMDLVDVEQLGYELLADYDKTQRMMHYYKRATYWLRFWLEVEHFSRN